MNVLEPHHQLALRRGSKVVVLNCVELAAHLQAHQSSLSFLVLLRPIGATLSPHMQRGQLVLVLSRLTFGEDFENLARHPNLPANPTPFMTTPSIA